MIDDYINYRRQMIEEQLIPRGISSEPVLRALEEVPRHLFVPPYSKNIAYADCALPIGEGQTISQPYMVAIMTEQLDITGLSKVLEIGTGSGYQAAILAQIANKIITIERNRVLYDRAKQLFISLDYDNIDCILGDGTLGYTKEAPYNGIIVTAAAPKVPDSLLDQLADGGILVIPVGDMHLQELQIIKKRGDQFITTYGTGCRFVPLIGEKGWAE
ncbi:MAG: protein-L-isoaspartate(D-aspartate) O-methyltransferase [Candidatus Margulisiibacteriota bacterium]